MTLSDFLVVAQAAQQSSSIHPVLGVLAFLAMLFLLVLVHELGHFLTARAMGISVDEFGIGYPPRALTLFTYQGVKYTLNWVPLGGFVRFKGEGDEIYGVGSLAAAKPWRRILVMAAGPLMNLLLALFIFAVLFIVQGIPQTTGRHLLTEVYPNTAASQAGLQPQDLILSINGQTLRDTAAINAIAMENGNKAIPIVIKRGDKELTLTITPGPWTTPDGEARAVGFGFRYTPETEIIQANPIQAIGESFNHTFDLLNRMIHGLGSFFSGLMNIGKSSGGVAGPIGIARATGEVIEQNGVSGFWNWTALLSINLFLLNLLPIPALDGSHILLALVEWVRRGKRLPPEKEGIIHLVGFATLMALIVIVSINDIINAFNGAPVLK